MCPHATRYGCSHCSISQAKRWFGRPSTGTQVTYFTGTKVQILTRLALNRVGLVKSNYKEISGSTLRLC